MRIFVTILFLTLASTFGSPPTGAVPPRVNSNPVTQEYDVTWWGASTNSLDNSSAINQSIAYVSSVRGGVVRVPTGSFTVSGRIDLSNNVMLKGSGMGATTLIFTNMTTPDGAFVYATGTTNLLPVQASDIAIGSKTVTFASDPALRNNDLYFVVNTASGSFSGWRPTYYQGEALRVATYTGNTVTNTSRTYAAYTGTTNSFYKINAISPGFEGMTVIFPTGVSAPGIRISLAQNFLLRDLKLINSRADHIFIDRCVDGSIERVQCLDQQGSIGENYGVIVGNSQNILVDGLNVATMRHSFATGGGDIQPAIVNRNITVSRSLLGCINLIAGVPGANLHGNSEWCSFTDCDMPSGIEIGGDHTAVVNCRIGNGNPSGLAYVTSEIVGYDHVLKNCQIRASTTYDNGMISVFNRQNVARVGGSFRMSDCEVDVGNFGSSNFPTLSAYPVQFGCTFGTLVTTTNLAAEFSHNEFRSSFTSGPVYVFYNVPVTNSLERVSFINHNTFSGVGLKITPNLKIFEFENSIINNAPENGVVVNSLGDAPSWSNQQWFVNNVKIFNAQRAGWISTLDTNTAYLRFKNSVLINEGQSGISKSSAFFIGQKVLELEENTFGDNQAVSTQTGFYSVTDTYILSRGRNYDIGRNINSLPVTLTRVTNDVGIAMSSKVMWSWSGTAPTSTTYTNFVGDIVWNSNPNTATNSTPGWVIAATGAPGTIFTMAPMDATGYMRWDFLTKTFGIGTTASTLYNEAFQVDRSTNAAVLIRINNQDTGTAAASVIRFVGHDGQSDFGVYPANFGTTFLQDKMAASLASNVAGYGILGSTSGQTFTVAMGGTTTGVQLSGQVWRELGGAQWHRNAQAGTYAVATNDFVIASTGTSTKTLPAANTVFAGQVFVIMSGNTFTTTVARTGSDTINGAAADDSLTSNVSGSYMSDGVSNYQKF